VWVVGAKVYATDGLGVEGGAISHQPSAISHQLKRRDREVES
jgi:hypothetical protein